MHGEYQYDTTRILSVPTQVTAKVTAEVTAALEESHRQRVMAELKLKQAQAGLEQIKASGLACAVSPHVPA